MLRWKTQSALCAILISACPLTSFAQQIGSPEQSGISNTRQPAVAINAALQPLQSASRSRSAGTSLSENGPVPRKLVGDVASPDVVIRAPFVQPHNPNLYLFVVENVGPVDATFAAVDLHVPANVTITNVAPAPSAGGAQWAQVRLTNLAAGSKSIIEIEISPTAQAVEFTTRLALESVQSFTTPTDSNYIGNAGLNPALLPAKVATAMLQEAVEDSKYLIPNVQASHVASPRLNARSNPAQAQTAESAASQAQTAADEKLLKTVRSLRLAGQDALADAYIAAIANSKTYQAETF